RRGGESVGAGFDEEVEPCTSTSGWSAPDATTRPATRPDGRTNSSERSPLTSIFCSWAALEPANGYAITRYVPALSPVKWQDPDASVVAIPVVPVSPVVGFA